MVPNDGLAMIEGIALRLRLIEADDAEYVHGLRTDPAYNAHLSPVSGTAADQRRWIEAYKGREAERRELYYVIERRDGVRCGLVRLYEITTESFTWGSWMLDASKPPKAALESAVLSFGVGFEGLQLPTARFEVRRENARALAFYRRLGATQTHETDQDIYFEYPAERFAADKPGYLALLEGEQQA